jgi:hypothetical protein
MNKLCTHKTMSKDDIDRLIRELNEQDQEIQRMAASYAETASSLIFISQKLEVLTFRFASLCHAQGSPG